MDINDIRNSGLLELYLIGSLNEEEEKKVELALQEFPELQKELLEMAKALELYATVNSVNPPKSIWKNIQTELGIPSSDDTNIPSQNAGAKFKSLGMPILFVLVAGFALWNFLDNRSKIATLQSDNELCQSQNEAHQRQIALFETINSPTTNIVALAATPSFGDTKLYFYNDNANKKNFIKLSKLPNIDDTKSFQLWSLKADTDPIPLDVFQEGEDLFIEVAYEDDTSQYAITIEPKGGSPTPTLEQLIGTFPLS